MVVSIGADTGKDVSRNKRVASCEWRLLVSLPPEVENNHEDDDHDQNDDGHADSGDDADLLPRVLLADVGCNRSGHC